MLVMDHRLWDPIRHTFTVNAYIQDARRRFGGIDSIIMSQWDSYPNLGVDERNQFDFFRSMPGGAVGLKTLVYELHAAGLRVLFSFNPWDTLTHDEGGGALRDGATLAEFASAVSADGFLMDTYVGTSAQLHAACPHCALESEGYANSSSPSLQTLADAKWTGHEAAYLCKA
jgi:iron(II)-dependent oxidoreductase